MKLKRLEMVLSRLDDIELPDPSLEQYRTPASIVSKVLLEAANNGDILDMSVAELGCGSAPFAIGALLIGARSAWGCDIDPKAVKRSRENLVKAEGLARTEGLVDRATFVELDVSGPSDRFPKVDTVLMNPPFGAQKRGADRPFLERALSMADVVYTIHNAPTAPFVRKLVGSLGGMITSEEMFEMELPHRFAFHTNEKGAVEVVLFRIVTGNGGQDRTGACCP